MHISDEQTIDIFRDQDHTSSANPWFIETYDFMIYLWTIKKEYYFFTFRGISSTIFKLNVATFFLIIAINYRFLRLFSSFFQASTLDFDLLSLTGAIHLI